MRRAGLFICVRSPVRDRPTNLDMECSMKLEQFAAAAALIVISPSALAGPADDAKSHFQAVAAGDLDKIMTGYGDDAVFQWVGGALDGAYKGVDAIRGVWTKFTKANAPLEATVDKLEESANPAGSTVTANVTYSGKNTIKVRYVLTYRADQLVNEVWQIDPKLGAGY
jgi:ketosteroid isomerase-like protein